MKKKQSVSQAGNREMKASCFFCGSTVGEKCECTGGKVSAIYDCPRCDMNYCDQCSYERDNDGKQRCLRCDSKLKKVM
jgi:hypothetical protein